MIVSRAPVRFSLGGGGTDLPSYANEHGGFLVAAAIERYVFVAANRRFSDSIRLAYSKTETVDTVDQIEHRIFREALRFTGVHKGIELVSIADVPSNSGLGSSSSFTVALLNALHAYNHDFVSTEQLAREACQIEIDILKEPIGKQDQYIAAYGGITAFTFNKDGTVESERLPISAGVVDELESNLIIFYSGVERAASSVLKEQGEQITQNKDDAVQRMHRIKALGYETRDLLLRGDIDRYGEMLHEHWTNKRTLASNMTDAVIDEHYEAARKAGAIGGKLMGAGGGGFFMFYTRPADKRRLRDVMCKRGLEPLRFRFDQDGARIVANFHRSLAGDMGVLDTFTKAFLDESVDVIQKIDVSTVEALASGLADVRAKGGRLFILGVGGSAGHASHAVNDFRKICAFEAYTPTDNVSELTARTNDDGWDSTFSEWLKGSRLREGDALLIFSVGGGNREKNVSVNLVRAIDLAKEVGAKVFGIVGRDGGYTLQMADVCVLIPTVSAARTTPHTEGMCAVVWHLLVSHPVLQKSETKWESVKLMRPAIILDRDGTLIDTVRDDETGVVTTAFHPSHLRLLPGVVPGLTAFQSAGYVLAIATNQPGPAKGHFSTAAVARTNVALVAMLAAEGIAIARVEVCMHHPDGGPGGDSSLVFACPCRKPLAGMLDTLIRDLDLDREATWMVGDSISDVRAGRAARVKTAHLQPADRCDFCPSKGGSRLVAEHADVADVCVASLADMAQVIFAT